MGTFTKLPLTAKNISYVVKQSVHFTRKLYHLDP